MRGSGLGDGDGSVFVGEEWGGRSRFGGVGLGQADGGGGCGVCEDSEVVGTFGVMGGWLVWWRELLS